MRLFEEVPGLSELEQAEHWDEAVNLLYDNWCSDKENVEKLCRVLFECWYVMDDTMNDEMLLFSKCQEKLIEVTQYGVTHCSSDPLFLWLAGYAISLFPFFFYEGNNSALAGEWEQKGKEMLICSTKIAPDNLIAKVFFYGLESNNPDYLLEKLALAPHLDDLIPGNSAIERYFRAILTVEPWEIEDAH